jgi:RimJ/RimL family protein N-acetyltransferase
VDFDYVRHLRTRDGQLFCLRPATRADSEAITGNIRAVCTEQVYLHTDTFVETGEWQRLQRPLDEEARQLLLVAEMDGRVVGHAHLCPEWYGPKGWHVAEIGIALLGPCRERGIGTAMMVYLLEWAARVGFEKVTASVIATNRRALALFAKFDFVHEGQRARQLKIGDEYADEVLLGRFLDGSSLGLLRNYYQPRHNKRGVYHD